MRKHCREMGTSWGARTHGGMLGSMVVALSMNSAGAMWSTDEQRWALSGKWGTFAILHNELKIKSKIRSNNSYWRWNLIATNLGSSGQQARSEWCYATQRASWNSICRHMNAQRNMRWTHELLQGIYALGYRCLHLICYSLEVCTGSFKQYKNNGPDILQFIG